LEAYQIAADTLLGWEGEVEEKQFLAACRKRGAAYRSEGRVGAASVSLPLFEQAMGLARHRGLLSAGPEERAALAAEIGDALRRTGVSRGLRARVG
jgi:glycerol-3-phosphate O-acyltransferase